LPVTALRRPFVILRDDLFADDRRQVRRAMTEVDDRFGVRLLRSFDGERPVERSGAGVAEIVLHDRVTARETCSSSLKRDVACRAATADAKQLAVPVCRQPIDGAD